ncbi:MAG: TraX family protein [Eubacteriales bacterium]|nr:TraX family protein [Eubacteriales bacterium]
MKTKPFHRFQFNSFQLKMIALASMTIDHIGAVLLAGLLPSQAFLHESQSLFDLTAIAVEWRGLYCLMLACRLIGRLAFPLFCFLLVQGFRHSHDLQRYALRLGLFALISEPFFDLAVHGRLFDLESQNVFWTLLFGLLLLWLWHSPVAYPLRLAGLIVLAVLVWWSNCDYDLYGLTLIFLLDRLTPSSSEQSPPTSSQQLLLGFYLLFQLTACLSVPLITAYNGERGRKQGLLFYLYYPLHLAVLVLLRMIISGRPLIW